MRLATFLPPGESEPVAGDVRGDEVVAFADGTVRDRLASGDRTPADGPSYPLADVTLLAPVMRPRAIFGIGLNYAAHAAEGGSEPPEQPIVFMKVPTAVVPPGGPVRCPKVVRRLDYEGELAVVIGGGGEIAGYAIADDVSARDLQKREPQWTRAKGADTFCPWGPWITTADEVPDPRALRLVTRVNGEVRQDSPTSDLIFGPQELVDFPGAGRPHPHGHACRCRDVLRPTAPVVRRRRGPHRDRGARRDRAPDRDPVTAAPG
jgi:2-keto-4-pentenoate hydratase/2-oxohepta-3-ene-1,7-dioic acid hydratase in catechol pathway